VRRMTWSRGVLCAALLGVTMIMPMLESADDPPGGPAPPPEPGLPGPDTLANAVAATRAVDRARFELRTTVAQAGQELTFVHRGAFDDRGGRVQAEADMTDAAATLEAAGQPLDGDWSQPTRMVVAGETVYSQLGPMAEELGREPTDWTSAGLVAVMSQGATDNDTLALALDPLGPLDLLQHTVLEIGPAGGNGEASVRGEPAEHLRAMLALGGATPDGATEPSPGSFEGRLRAAGVESLPVDVWIDGDGVVRRLVVRLDASMAGGTGGSSLTTTFDLYDVNGDIEVEVPDPGDVVTGEE